MNLLQTGWDWLSSSANWHGGDGIPHRFLQHLGYSVLAMLIAMALALPLGLFMGHTGRGGFLAASLANAARALPTYGLLLLIVLWKGIGLIPVTVALVALAIPPILVNTYEGVRNVDADLKDAARGMGMSGPRVLLGVEAPVALPLILLGLRTAAIQIISTATIAAYVGLGGLGRYIVDGYATKQYETVVGGAFLIVALAFAITALFYVLERILVPAGVRYRTATT